MREHDDVAAFIERIVADAGIADDGRREDLRRELRAHFEDAGGSPEAVREAMRRFGAEGRIAASLRDVHRADPLVASLTWTTWMGGVFQDLRFGARMLRRSPGFSVVAILSLTLGIGATTAVVGWIEGILLRPFPLVAAQDRLVAIAGTNRGAPGSIARAGPASRRRRGSRRRRARRTRTPTRRGPRRWESRSCW